jgi:hypothetical protein
VSIGRQFGDEAGLKVVLEYSWALQLIGVLRIVIIHAADDLIDGDAAQPAG